MAPNIPVSPVVVKTKPKMTIVSAIMASSFSGSSLKNFARTGLLSQRKYRPSTG
jgi:hypothetical protein